ncbi:RagB/SusD family nutrient uptake outer membrane protein [Pedobacter sp. ASV1-7]|uniref:RagB/SusD family nutrient uptake outer membrane protein n=1 Tax=Pedobacter sp. ASV1-7 TaxID=3145237 RepID=UPI0032E91BA9
MKRITLLYSIVLILTTLSSCKKFLGTDPQDFLTPKSFYDTEEQLNLSLAAVYSPLGDAALYAGRIGRSGLDADDGFYDRSTDITGVSSYNVAAADPNVRSWWSTCYRGINRANLLLANIDKPVMNETNRAVIEGETKFLRAYYYFLLVSNFGDVPLLLNPTETIETTAVPRTPLKDVYAKIIADMEDAEAKVKTAQAVGFGGRINKSAVRGLLARVNLFMAGFPLKDETRYAEAHKWAKMVKDDATHALLGDFSQVFINYAADLYDIRESLWEIEFFGNTQGVFRESGQVGTNLGITYNSETTANNDPNQAYGYGFLNATGVLWQKYENPTSLFSYDLRRDWSIAPFTLGAGNPAKETPRPITEIYQRDAGKYRRVYETVFPKEKNYSPMNYPVLRFSDVLLMFAEADNFINKKATPEAIEAVNMVRRRGYGKYLNGIGQNSQSIKSITITKAGSGYTTPLTVTITGGGGIDAKATATLASGGVSKITLTNPGKKFNGTPITISFSGGSGTGAEATATLTTNTDADLTADKTTSQEVFLKTIQDERSRELCFEALRKGDLVRWGLLVENMKIVYAHILDSTLPSTMEYIQWPYRNVSQRDVVWPIPAFDMGLNSALVQNTGW